MTLLPSSSSPDTNTEMNLIHTFSDSMQVIPFSEVKVKDSEHTCMWNELKVPTECYIKRAHSHFVDVVAICRIASIEDTESIDVCIMRSTMDSVITTKYFKIPWLDSPNSCVIFCELSLWFSFHGCNYGILIGWCLSGLWVTCSHVCWRCYTSAQWSRSTCWDMLAYGWYWSE
jgi:hypothetical protein